MKNNEVWVFESKGIVCDVFSTKIKAKEYLTQYYTYSNLDVELMLKGEHHTDTLTNHEVK